mmetsp:Transcript_72285/g.207397  ORF Transcript_72285/g.207397 Transcript_72285/m.207397 type:complete len:254 (-) Transcript_72285:13-774(-)
MAAFALRSSAAAGATFVAWRQLYMGLHGEHRIRVRADFELGLSGQEGFKVMSDPCLLDETTPWWFHVVIRDGGRDAIGRLAGLVEQTSRASSSSSSSVAPPAVEVATAVVDPELQISYWIFFGRFVPIPWTSSVAPVSLEQGWCRLTYRQAFGPYRAFEHTHWVRDAWEIEQRSCAGGAAAVAAAPEARGSSEAAEGPRSPRCLVKDTIVATVLGEPVLDFAAAVLLKQILRCRGDCLTRRFGGRVLSVREEE